MLEYIGKYQASADRYDVVLSHLAFVIVAGRGLTIQPRSVVGVALVSESHT
jgi:hypothetical protein